MKDTISISLIEHEGEVVGGSFEFARPAQVKASKAKATKATAKSPNRKAAAARPQPPAVPAALKWQRDAEEYTAYAEPPPYSAPPASLPLAPQPPSDFSHAPAYADEGDDYQFAPGGIAYEGDVDALVTMRRSRPRFLTFGFALVAVAITLSGAAQLGKGGSGTMLAGHAMYNVNAAAQVAPYLQSQQPQAESAAQSQPQPAGSTAERHPSGDYRLLGAPSISVATIERVLHDYNSPAIGNGQTFYDLGVKYGVDPAFMLAFYVHESSAGTMGAAVDTKSIGNIICPGWAGRCIGRFRAYDNYVQAAEDWYQLITGNLYIGDGLTTPELITPRYAPSSDNNDPNGYAKTVEHLVDQWRGWQ